MGIQKRIAYFGPIGFGAHQSVLATAKRYQAIFLPLHREHHPYISFTTYYADTPLHATVRYCYYLSKFSVNSIYNLETAGYADDVDYRFGKDEMKFLRVCDGVVFVIGSNILYMNMFLFWFSNLINILSFIGKEPNRCPVIVQLSKGSFNSNIHISPHEIDSRLDGSPFYRSCMKASISDENSLNRVFDAIMELIL